MVKPEMQQRCKIPQIPAELLRHAKVLQDLMSKDPEVVSNVGETVIECWGVGVVSARNVHAVITLKMCAYIV